MVVALRIILKCENPKCGYELPFYCDNFNKINNKEDLKELWGELKGIFSPYKCRRHVCRSSVVLSEIEKLYDGSLDEYFINKEEIDKKRKELKIGRRSREKSKV